MLRSVPVSPHCDVGKVRANKLHPDGSAVTCQNISCFIGVSCAQQPFYSSITNSHTLIKPETQAAGCSGRYKCQRVVCRYTRVIAYTANNALLTTWDCGVGCKWHLSPGCLWAPSHPGLSRHPFPVSLVSLAGSGTCPVLCSNEAMIGGGA